MTWVVWRQHRNQVYFAAGAFGALAVLLLVTGVQMASQYQSALLACAQTDSCADLTRTLTLGSPLLFSLVPLTAGVPGLLGAFWGAPLVARELETRTSQFVWMQTVTRRHWLAVKIGWALFAAAVWGGALAALVTWWSGPENALKQDRFEISQFAIQGIVPIGYGLFAVALGIAAGAVLRRTLPAVAVTIGVFAALRITIESFARPHYQTPLTMAVPLGQETGGPAGSSWMLNSGITYPDGRPIKGVSILRSGTDRLPGAVRAGRTVPGPRLHGRPWFPQHRRLPAGKQILDVPGHRDPASSLPSPQP